jgi:hypothetical protein
MICVVLFKLAFESITLKYQVPGNWSTEYFFDHIRGSLCRDFNIPNTFYIVPGPGLQRNGYDGRPEDHPPVLISLDETVEEYCNPNEINAFYIRFTD